jgi:membrane-associated protease RseP (regulator of RpoE activity)
MTQFNQALDPTRANQQVTLKYAKGTNKFTKELVLADKANYSQNLSHQGQGYLGIVPSDNHKGFLTVLQNPFVRFPDGFLLFYIIPLWGYLQGYNPIVSPFTDSYVITGVLSFLPSDVFWVLINVLYWIFWLNFAVALFNVLPMIPLDGGFLFNDAVSTLVKKIKKVGSEEQRQILVKNISLVLSLIILFLIIFPFLIKYI